MEWDLEEYIGQKALGHVDAAATAVWANCVKAMLLKFNHRSGTQLKLNENENEGTPLTANLLWNSNPAPTSGTGHEERVEKGAYLLACLWILSTTDWVPETRVEKGSGYDLHLIKRREGLGSIRDPYNFLQYEITPG